MRRKLIDADEFTSELAKAYAEQSETAGTWERLITTQLLASFSKEVTEVINALPTVDAEAVRHGKWIEYSFPAHECIYCSECKEEYAPEALWDLDGNSLPKYCPNCGARMDEE